MKPVLVGHVINRASRVDRRRRFQDWNGGHPVDWRWHVAAEPEDTAGEPGLLARDAAPPPLALAATALSHRRQWQACVAEGVPRLVCEDDSCLRLGAAPLIARAMVALATVDLVYFGCNADAEAMIETADRLFCLMTFGASAQADPGYFEHFARHAPPIPAPHLFRTQLVWGLGCYAISPAGAARLLDLCFPLVERRVELFRDRAGLAGFGIDLQINAALQRGQARAMLCFPPLAVGPNGDSDLDPRKT